MAVKQTTKELIDLINDLKNGSKSYGKVPFDENHWFRQIFRLYIDGSHTYPGNQPGYKFVERMRERVADAKGNDKKLTGLVVESFMNAMSVEFPEISRSTIQKTILKHFKPDELKRFNQDLLDDLKQAYLIDKI